MKVNGTIVSTTDVGLISSSWICTYGLTASLFVLSDTIAGDGLTGTAHEHQVVRQGEI